MNRISREAFRAGVCGLAVATLLGYGTQAHAQQADSDEGEERSIVVTGSRIVSGFDRPTPVSVLGAARLEERGATNLGDALNELPAFRATNSPASTGLGAAAGYVGGRILDLRGLGAVRTLTLVDGKRFVPSTTQATVDTNMIPSVLLQRAEVVTGGASAVYGSDAVSGVVNLLIDKKFTGYKANGQVGFSQYGDNFTTQFGLAGGWQIGENLHVILGGEYERAEGVEACRERPWCAYGLINISRNPGVTSIPANNILAGVYPWTAPYNGVTTPPSSAYTGKLVPTLRPIDGIGFTANGTPFRTTQGVLANNLYSQGGTNDGPGENIYFDFPIVSPTKRYNLMGFATWEATPALTIELGFNYGHNQGYHRAVPYRNTAITIRNDNPFIPTSSDPSLDLRTLMTQAGVTSFTLGKGFRDVGAGDLVVKDDVYRAVLSATYDISDNWKADIYYQYGENKFRSDITGGTITSRILKALDAVAGPNGPVCRVNADANTTNDDPACVALNPFGSGQGATFAAAKAYVKANAFQTNNTTQHVVAANITGSLVELPAGKLSVAVGGEYRSDSVNGDADALSKSLSFFTGNGSVISGKIEVAEVYGETEVPLLRDMTAFQELSLNGAVRRTHYKRSSALFPSSTVNVTTWKIGGVWAPISAIRFRATRSRDIRAPNVSELFGPITSSSGILNDPFNGGQQTVVPITLGSNPNLRPEKADTLTVGVVVQPGGNGFLGRVRGSVDYFDMKIKDAISTLGQQNIVTRCFQGDALSCAQITRNASNIITNVTDVYQNVNQLKAKGIDFELGYRQPIGSASSLDLTLLASHMIDLITVDAVGPVERAGQTGLRGGTPPGIPNWTLDATANLSLGERFSFSTHVRWINKGFYNAAFVGPEQSGFTITRTDSSSTNAVPGRTYVDMLATVKVPVGGAKKASLYFGIDNVFDIDPPAFPGANGSGNNVLFNPVGRMFKAGVRAVF